ncbi:Non-specific serine/threonine protein kinase protein [Dioscorea alata]|uniref:Non-specific serine/threonine protein kinase protein n=2 Tax=Dioscorea alata TaxID=55571 RepID=A0ACB7W1I4_DIOAL|nr:Non-specific serine/threonine protein kinase protein [Dioscorea alata]KAH7681286.1 Non-specific serine/threonine protein kinase protein [Dioscorea alata]
MGHSSKKKKKRSGSGRKSKGRTSSGDGSSLTWEDQDELFSEELTSLTSIFQEDVKIVSEANHSKISVNIRPFSDETGFEVLDFSVLLVVRCLPGYPHRCPKLQIISEKGLSKEDADRLHSLLVDQANVNARDGRVMIFNLVEAAREFLSEIAPLKPPLISVPSSGSSVGDSNSRFSGSFTYGSIDLFGDLCGEQTSWGGHGSKVANDNSYQLSGKQSSFTDKNRRNAFLMHTQTLNKAKNQAISKLDVLEEDTECDTKSESSSDHDTPLVGEPLGNGSDIALFEDSNVEEHTIADGYSSEGKSSTSSRSASEKSGKKFQSKKKDLLMVHLLHLVCSSKKSLAHALPELSSELNSLGILSEWGKLLTTKPPKTFSEAFKHTFGQHMIGSQISEFWKTDLDLSQDSSSSLPNSRYLSDFEEVNSLGHGGFGHVVLCKNKLDGRLYAVKKIRLKDKSPHVNDKILREVATLSRLQHQHIVRYYQAWYETGPDTHHGDIYGSRTMESLSCTQSSNSLPNATGLSDNNESAYLYIQMEYCPRTLRQDFEACNDALDKDYTWLLFRQIVEGLAHIHGQGIIHRDLTPNNIFFDVRNDIKIGDFGLAKFLKLEELDHDQHLLTETSGVSVDGTGQVGTYFYTAPEIEQRWPQINEKVDMYSLGVVFFELWHPFATAMERHIVLSDLKLKGLPPPSWAIKFPDQAALLQRLMSPSPSDRPSASELLQNALPPRMEDEWLNDVLRTIWTSEDTYVYDRVVSTIFDEERLLIKDHQQHVSSGKMSRDESSFGQCNEYDTELQDKIFDVTKEVFRQHGAKRLEISPMSVLDGCHPIDRKGVKLLNRGGNMLQLCNELRSPFVTWISSQQGDFDIIGGAPSLTEAEVIKVVVDIATRFLNPDAISIQLNHGALLEAIWTWAGIPGEHRQCVAELLSSITSSCPQSAIRKTNWALIRRQLLQDRNISAATVDRLQTADLRFCGSAEQTLARLRGALSPDKFTHKAFEEMSALLSYLRIWGIEKNISADVLLPPPEDYYKDLYFQIHFKENSLGAAYERTLFALGGCYNHLLRQKWDHQHKSYSPNAVGVSLALEKIFPHSSVDIRNFRCENHIGILVCSKGGGGLLQERMEIVAELWQANLKAELVPLLDPSLTEQYEYANEHDLKCLIVITEAGLSQTGLVKVRHLELKKEWEVGRNQLVKFLTEAISTQFRNLPNWN